MFANRMSLQMLRQLVDKVFTNSFPVRGMPDDLGGALKLAEQGEIELNPPVEPNQVEQRFRGRVAYDKAKCIGCKVCIKVCPANAIEYLEDEKKIQIHSDRCCFCAQCTEVCPVNCLAMSDDFLFSSYDRKAEVVTDSGNFGVTTENIMKAIVLQPQEETEEGKAEPVAETKPKYEIDQEKCIGCTKCARICPVEAISGEPKKPHVIDKEVCVACGQCADACPVSAIHVEGEGAAMDPEEKPEPEKAPAAEKETRKTSTAKKTTSSKTAKKTSSKSTSTKKDSEEEK